MKVVGLVLLLRVFFGKIISELLLLGSEPVVFGFVMLNKDLFWLAVLVAIAGNTLGGVFIWWNGYGAECVYEYVKHVKLLNVRVLRWLQWLGAKVCLLSWLLIVGDFLCVVVGWFKLLFWLCVFYMVIGKFMRYFMMIAVGIWFWFG